MTKIKKNSNIILVFGFSIILLQCVSKKMVLEPLIFNHSCKCDSISVPSYNFNIEDDSAVYSLMEKEPFNFVLQISNNYIKIDNKVYYFLLAGLELDTIGILHITDESYIYKKDKNSTKSALLFSFYKNINDSWLIKEDGYFENYKVSLKEIEYNNTLEDTVFSFNYNFLGDKFPNGYYFISFKVTKRYGIISYSFDNGVNCISRPKTD